jgi:ABC-type nitrate/sulfonate/bicarbonate transport system substrate-binding protein
MRQMGELVRIPITGIATAQRKTDKERDEVVRLLRALRGAIGVLLEQRDYAVGLFEKALRLDRASAEKFYALFRDEFNPDLTLPDTVVNDLLAVGSFRSKEKMSVNLSPVRDWSFAEQARR